MTLVWVPIIVGVLCFGGCAFAIGYMMGYTSRKHETNETALEHTKQLQKTYGNGIRVGKREMLDMLVHYKLITEADASAVSEEI